MMMPPSGGTGIMDEDTLIQAQIDLELENIQLDNNDEEFEDMIPDEDEGEEAEEDNVPLPRELDDYIKKIQEQTNKFERELEECDDLIHHTDRPIDSNMALMPYDDHRLLVQLAEDRGCDVEVYKQKILAELEEEEDVLQEDILDYIDLESADEGQGQSNQQGHTDLEESGLGAGDGPYMTSHAEEVKLDMAITEAVESGVDPGEVPVSQELVPVNKNIHIDIQRMLRDQLDRLEQRYKERTERIKKEEAFSRNEDDVRDRRVEEERRWKQQEIEREEQKLAEEKEIAQRKLAEQEAEREEQMQESIRKFQMEMAALEEETRREKEELQKALEEQQTKQNEKENDAANTIQRVYKGYRARKEYQPVLEEKKEERKKLKEEERIKEVEKEIEERKKEKEQKEEEERRHQEEQKQLEEEKKRQKELEKQQKEEEKKRKKEEEERRKVEEKLRKEEEKKRLEEEKKRKKEEEKRRKEEEKRKKDEEEQRKKEEKRLKEEEEKRRKEEEKRLKEEEKKRKEEEARLKKEEEERKKKEEQEIKRLEEEKKREEERIQKEREKKEEEERLKREVEKSNADINKSHPSEAMDVSKTCDKSVNLAEKDDSVDLVALNHQSSKISGEKEIKMEQSPKKKESENSKKVPNSDLTVRQSSENIERSVTTPRSARSSRPPTPRKKPKSVQESVEKTIVNGEEKQSEPVDSLPEPLEKMRLKWIKECLPWSKISNEPWKLKTSVSRKPLRRPSSAKKLPLLAEELIIQAARVVSLKQVTTVQLQDLPGFNMSSLGQCWGLKSLSMINCNLVAVYGLEQCKQLQNLELKNNYIEYIDVKDIGQLQYVDLSHNRLSSIHGMDNCTNLRWFDLSYNKITRIGGVETLRRLHTLDLSHNQVISTQGLGDTPTLHVLNLSHNHLQEVEDLEKLCLLLQLDMSSNNLLKVPCLRNQVLLHDLLLEDNSITSLDELTTYWLPLLQTLKVGQNSLNSLPSLKNCHILRELDVSNNQLLDSQALLTSLDHLVLLEVLHLEENPLVQDLDSSFHKKLSEMLPRLHTWTGSTVDVGNKKGSPLKPRSSYEAMCLTQAKMYRDLHHHFEQDLKSCQQNLSSGSLEKLGAIHFKYCDKTFKMSVEYRYAHEYGEVTVTMPKAPTVPKSDQSRSNRTKVMIKEESYMNPKEMFEKALNSSQGSLRNLNSADTFMSPKEMFEKALGTTSSSSSSQSVPSTMMKTEIRNGDTKAVTAEYIQSEETSKKVTNGRSYDRRAAAIKIQAAWRGYAVRQEIAEQTQIWLAAVTLQAAWRGYLARKLYRPLLKERLERRKKVAEIDPALVQRLHQAAVKIQAWWRGYYLRSKLQAALDYARLEDDEEEDGMELDGDFDIDKFMGFNEDMLDNDWKPPDMPQLPVSHPVLKKPPSGRTRVAPLNIEDRPPSNPRRAWRNAESPLSDILHHQGHIPRPPSSVTSGDTHRTGMTRKEEKLSEEWGFKDSSTAHVMLQRAKKMKYNAEKKKKLGKLDPKQRLALFRKLEEVTHPSVPVQQPQRRTLPRKEYFQARQDEIDRQEREKRDEYQMRVSRTYEWLHMQVGNYEITDSVINKNSRQQNQSTKLFMDSNLPRMDPDVQLGRRVQLVSSPSLDLQSVDSASNVGERPRRFSAGSGGHSSASMFPPIQTGSAPTSHVKERMSWRSKPVNQSVGWGGGKKRTGKK